MKVREFIKYLERFNPEAEITVESIPEEPAHTRKRPATLAEIVSYFRILDDWKVRWGRGQYRRLCNLNIARKIAIVYPWGSISREPSIYRLHEVLHIALAALDGGRDRSKERKNIEEELIQDICEIFNNKYI